MTMEISLSEGKECGLCPEACRDRDALLFSIYSLSLSLSLNPPKCLSQIFYSVKCSENLKMITTQEI